VVLENQRGELKSLRNAYLRGDFAGDIHITKEVLDSWPYDSVTRLE
jgi:hypothetical protein